MGASSSFAAFYLPARVDAAQCHDRPSRLLAAGEQAMLISTIVVGVDHSDRSDKAITKANGLGLEHGARIVIEYALNVGGAQKLWTRS